MVLGRVMAIGLAQHGFNEEPEISIIYKARAFVRRLGLISQREWSAYCKSGKKPKDIPQAPNEVYANDGWVGLGDWLVVEL